MVQEQDGVGDEEDGKGNKARMDMVCMAHMGNILGMGYMGDTRMDRTKDRTKRCPMGSMHTKNCSTKGYTNLCILN